MSSKSTAENNVCVQFSQHVWKRDVCKNCSKPQSAHKANISNNIPKTNAGNNLVAKTPNLKSGEKPLKPNKKPSLSKSVLTKQAKSENIKTSQPVACPKPPDPIYDIYDVSAKGKSGKPVNLNVVVSVEAANDSPCLMATPYTVVDVITSSLEKNRQALQQKLVRPSIPPSITSEPPLQKTPTNKKKDFPAAFMKSEFKMKNQGNSITSTVDIDINNKHGSSNAANIDDYDLNNWNSVSSEHYKARLYEEIDDLFMEKVETLKKEAAVKRNNVDMKKDNKNEVKGKNDQINEPKIITAEKKGDLVKENTAKNSEKKVSKSTDKNSKGCLEGGHNESCENNLSNDASNAESNDASNSESNDASNAESNDKMTNSIKIENSKTPIEANIKKSEKKSFLKRLLGKSSKSIEGGDNAKLNPIIKNNSLSDILDSHDSLGADRDDARYKKKFSQGDMISHNSVDVFSEEAKTENDESSRASLSTPNGGGGALRDSGTSFSGNSCTQNDSLNSSSHDLKPAKFSLSSDDLDSVDDKKARSPSTSSAHHSSSARLSGNARTHPQFISATMRRPHPSNRKSMTAAETRITRRMLLAPPPPPPSTSPTQLSTSPTQLSTSSFCTATLNRPAILCKKTTDIQVERNELIGSQPTNEVESVENKGSLLDGFMADLDAILKKGGVTVEVDNQSKSLPRLHPPDQLSRANSAPKGVETLPLASVALEGDPSRSLQQRALPEIPAAILPPPITISPDNDGLYEVLPNVQNKRPQIEPPGLPADKPRPAPRPAIRSVTTTTRQKRRGLDGGRGPEGSMEDNPRVPVKLNDPMEEQFKKMNILSLDSLHSFLEQFQQSSSSPPLNRCSQDEGKDLGEGVKGDEKNKMDGLVDWMRKSEGRVVYWRRCVFFEVDSFEDNSFLVMVRQANVLCLPLPSYHHTNLVCSVSSFDHSVSIPRCSQFFQPSCDHHYMFDILPYSSILSLPVFADHHGKSVEANAPQSDERLSNKQILVLFLQMVDSLLHLQRLGVAPSRLHAQDVFLVTSSIQQMTVHAEKTSPQEAFPILIPTEFEESPPISHQQALLSDLLHLFQLLISCNHSTEQLLVQQEQAQHPTPKFRSNGPQRLCDTDTKFINCFFKVASFLRNKSSSSAQWADVEVLRNVLEFSLWGPESSDEEIRLAFIDPKRRELFLWWLSCSRQRILNELILHNLPGSSKSRNQLTNDLPQSSSNTPANTPSYLRSLLSQLECPCSGEDFRRLREAGYLSKCSVDLLFDAAKQLYF